MTLGESAHDILRHARTEYAYNADIFCADDQKVRQAKRALSLLPDADRNVMILYCEYNSIRKLAEELHVSRSLLHRELARIKRTITTLMI